MFVKFCSFLGQRNGVISIKARSEDATGSRENNPYYLTIQKEEEMVEVSAYLLLCPKNSDSF